VTHAAPARDMRAHQLARRRGDYGFDAPLVPAVLGLVGIAAVTLSTLSAWLWHVPGWAAVDLVVGVFMLLSAACYLYTTRRGKFEVWAKVLAALPLRGDERALDLGCGRGAVLLMVVQLLPQGKAIGVDLWLARDQSGNAPEVTLRNAEREGVAARVELHTADMRALPLPDASVDLVLSSLAIHNIPGAVSRTRAIDEAARVLAPGGRLLIADIQATAAYARRLREQGMANVAVHNLGWRFWYGGPWVATRLVTATKPA